MDGTLERIDGRPALRFERQLAHSVERVWRAVSEPAELERWFPAAADWTPAAGETFEAGGATGEVTVVDAPHRLAWTFNGERYSFELAAHEERLPARLHARLRRPYARRSDRNGLGVLLLAARASPRGRLSVRRGGTRALGGSPRALRGALRGRSHTGPTLHRGPARRPLTRNKHQPHKRGWRTGLRPADRRPVSCFRASRSRPSAPDGGRAASGCASPCRCGPAS